MEYILIIIILLQFISILMIWLYTNKTKDSLYQFQSNNHQAFNQLIDRIDTRDGKLVDRNNEFERVTTSNLNKMNQMINDRLDTHFKHQETVIEKRLDKIDTKVSESLNDGFKNTQKTFTNIVERLSKIDEAQKNIEVLSTEIVSLQDVLTDKSSRGAFGEIQLNQILFSIFGERNDTIYKTQYLFSNGKRSDAVLFAPEPLGTIAIDSKFPLENYERIIKEKPNTDEYTKLMRLFTSDLKKHIDDIAIKYIITNETSNQAIMFVPAEAVFAHINAYHKDVIEYSQKKRVWITSPTTLMSTLTLVQTILINIKRDEQSHIIQKELMSLSEEFDRYKTRWDDLSRSIDRVSKDVKDINITTNKITKRFDNIQNVKNIK